jgi:hypothetical protein
MGFLNFKKGSAQSGYALYLIGPLESLQTYIKPNNYIYKTYFKLLYSRTPGHAVAYLVEALRYKPEGRGFESR